VICATVAFSAGARVPLFQPYLVFLPLIWAATRFGSRVAVIAMAASAALAIAFAVQDMGPFANSSLAAGLFELQAFMGFVAATTLFLGAASDERLAAVLDAQRALRMRDEFRAIASHELKTPLAALSLKVTGLCRDEAAEASKEASRATPTRAERARVQVARLTGLVEELLDVSRLTAGQLRLSRERFDLSEAIGDLVARTHEQASRVGCALSLAASGPVMGRWDRLRVEQVISNLLSNAFKYGAGRPVEVAITVEADGALAVVRVRDRGIGIQAADIHRIFDRFERATDERRHKGLGLGLYIARQVVSAHGGTIHVDSTSGEGSTFTVELPVTLHSYPPPESPPGPRSAAA
jgi:signal transduction histidine kinase